jgi:Family of unknown function (DUF6228)
VGRPVILASRTHGSLELTPDGTADDGRRRYWSVRLRGESLDAQVRCSEAHWLPESLASFFARLTGEPGSRSEETWHSEELRLTVSHPKENTMLVVAALAFQAPPMWTVEARIEMDPGAFGQAAEQIVHASALFA